MRDTWTVATFYTSSKRPKSFDGSTLSTRTQSICSKCHQRAIVSSAILRASEKIKRIHCWNYFLRAFDHSDSARLAFGSLYLRTRGLDAWLVSVLGWHDFWSCRPYSWGYWYLAKHKRTSHCIFRDGYFHCLQHLLAIPCTDLKANFLLTIFIPTTD